MIGLIAILFNLSIFLFFGGKFWYGEVYLFRPILFVLIQLFISVQPCPFYGESVVALVSGDRGVVFSLRFLLRPVDCTFCEAIMYLLCDKVVPFVRQ